MSKGIEVIGEFHPSGKSEVEEIKKLSSELIDLIDSIEGDPRRKSIAITNIETAAMFAVKSIFTKR